MAILRDYAVFSPEAALPPTFFLHTEVINDFPPRITSPPEPQLSNLYFPVNLTCIASGTPEPNITWYKDDERIPDQRLPFLYLPEFQLDDRGFYHCVAENVIRMELDEGTILTTPSHDISEKVVVNVKGK